MGCGCFGALLGIGAMGAPIPVATVGIGGFAAGIGMGGFGFVIGRSNCFPSCSRNAIKRLTIAIIKRTIGIQLAARQIGVKYQKPTKTMSGTSVRATGIVGFFSASDGCANAVAAPIIR